VSEYSNVLNLYSKQGTSYVRGFTVKDSSDVRLSVEMIGRKTTHINALKTEIFSCTVLLVYVVDSFIGNLTTIQYLVVRENGLL